MNENFHEAEFWDSRYRAGTAAWETAGVPQMIAAWIAAHPAGGAVLIPGCGPGREIAAFADAGWKVTAIDFSPTAVERARAHASGTGAEIILADFFTHPFGPGTFDLIYERTFLTALAPARWPAVATRYAELLKPGGRIVGYCCYGDQPDPPPFLQPPEAAPVFAADFQLESDEASPDALPFFGERERWQVWGWKGGAAASKIR